MTAPSLTTAIELIERAANEPERGLRRRALQCAAGLVARDATPAGAVVQVEARALKALVKHTAEALLIADPEVQA